MRLFVLLLVVHQIFAESETGLLDEKSFASGLNGFAYDVCKNLEGEHKNVIYSPLSISMSLGMLLEGAQGKNSEDIYKMLNMLQYSNKGTIHSHFKALMTEYKDMATRTKEPRNVTLELANAALVAENYNLPESYINALKTDYEASFSKENFAAKGLEVMEKINKYIKERTHDLIPQMLKEPLTPDAVFVLINTLYLKAFWSHEFKKLYTHNATFYNSDKTETSIEFMSKEPHSHKYYHCNQHKASIIELKYKGDLSMFVILPDDQYGLPKLIESWSKDKLASFIPEMKDTYVEVFLPKFEAEMSINLLTTFDKMGVNIRPALSALDPTLRITDAIHKSKIKVFEAGTEAASVTLIVSVTRTSPAKRPNPVIFKADHPFIYVIRDMKSNVNLFAGAVNKFN